MENSLNISQDKFRKYHRTYLQHDFISVLDEPWYIADTRTVDDPPNLCYSCRHINFRYLLKNYVKINRGPYLVLKDVNARTNTCSFCRLVVECLRHQDGTTTLETEKDEEYVICQLSSEEKDRRATSYHICLWRRKLFNRVFLYDPIFLQELSTFSVGSGGRAAPPQPDFSMLRRWLHRCETYHSPLERTETMPSNEQSRDLGVALRAIDVVDECIVILPALTRYLALSYVWGGVKGLELTKGNLEILMCRKSLTIDVNWTRIPQTIKDAISLVTFMGERYLWVDSLCIVQDDSDKHFQIGNMHHTYENAVLTIVAAYGAHANAGIPGIRLEQSTRNIRQFQERIEGNLTLANRLPDITVAVDESVWNTRGWTYQERILSQRLLLFTGDQIYFQCSHGASFCEDLVEEDNEENLLTTGQLEEITPGTINVLQPQDAAPAINFNLYTTSVKSYTSRSISFQADTLNAFAGVLQCLKPRFRSKFVFGLPETELDMAILWQPVSSGRPREDDSGHLLFPSWSWAGWDGKVDYLLSNAEILPRIAWKDFSSNTYIDLDTFRSPIDKSAENASTWILSSSDATFENFHESHDPLRLFLHPTARENERISRQLTEPHSGRFLGVQTLCARFLVSDRHASITAAILSCTPAEHNICALELHSEAGSCIGTLQLPSYLTLRMCNTTQDFILLSRTRLTSDPCDPQHYPSITNDLVDPTLLDTKISLAEDEMNELDYVDFDTSRYNVTKPWCLYNIMLIETRNEVSYRVGLGRVHVDAFLEATPTYREVLLG